MTTLRTAAQQALEALETKGEHHPRVYAAITALRAALAEPVLNPAPGYCKHCKQYTIEEPLPAEPVQKPVAWTYEWKHRLHGGSLNVSRARWPESHLWIETPLYAAPPQRKPLTEGEIKRLWYQSAVIAEPGKRRVAFGRAIERAHGIKE